MKKTIAALMLLLCLAIMTGCAGVLDGSDTVSPTESATTSERVQGETPPADDRFEPPAVGEGPALDYIPVDGQPQLKKIAALVSRDQSSTVSGVSCWDRFLLIDFYCCDGGGQPTDTTDTTDMTDTTDSADSADLEDREWSELVIFDLLTGEQTALHRFDGDVNAGFLENGYIYIYRYAPLSLKVYDRTGALSFSYSSERGGQLCIDTDGGGVAWVQIWGSDTVERLPLDGGEPIAYPLECESAYLQTAVGGEAYLSAVDGYGNESMIRLTAQGGSKPVAQLSGFYGIGNLLCKEGYGQWYYLDRAQAQDGIGYLMLNADESNAYPIDADGDCICFGREEDEYLQLTLCLPSLARQTDLTLSGLWLSGQGWGDGGIYLLLYDGQELAVYVWDYSNAPYRALDCGIYEVSSLEKENLAFSDSIREQWGVSVYFSEGDMSRTPSDYVALPVTDQTVISVELRKLADLLASYPDGFFDELTYGIYDRLEIYLCGGLSPIGGSGIGSAIAISNTRGSALVMVLDVLSINSLPQTFSHELLHLMERRINQIDPSLLADWSSLTPGGDDAYYFSYYDASGNEIGSGANTWVRESELDVIYFVDAYSKSYPTEDRARIFEYLVRYAGEPPFLAAPVLAAKADRLCEIIRLTFPSVATAEDVPWEGR